MTKQEFPEKKCEWCGEVFVPAREWQKFCCPKHRMQSWAAKHPRMDMEMVKMEDEG